MLQTLQINGPVLAAQHLEVLTHIIQYLGFIIDTKKSMMSPTQELQFLSMLVNTNTLLVSLPAVLESYL